MTEVDVLIVTYILMEMPWNLLIGIYFLIYIKT
jgi:hypothetical protein